MIALVIDTASALTGAGLFDGADLVAEVTWRSHQNHSRELLPAVDWLLASRGMSKTELDAVTVCLGPGSYAGLRVGLSTAKALAYARGLAIIGIGRLVADCEPLAFENGPPVYAVQAAGRAELAWAAYQRRGGSLGEISQPSLSREEKLVAEISAGAIACGELPASLIEALLAKGALISDGPSSRILALGRLGAVRLAAGEVDDLDSLVPMYLREPAIGPQPPLPSR